jgi:hypothetical protein
MLKFIRINLNIGLCTLIWGDTGIQSRHFVQIFIEILKNRVFCVICQPFFIITNKESFYSRSSEFILNTVPYLSVPYGTVPYRAVPCRIVPYRAVKYPTVPHPIVPYRTVLYRTVPYLSVPYPTVPYRSVPYRSVPYRSPLEFFLRSRSPSAKRTVLFPRLSAKKVKSTNHTVFQNKDHFSVLIDLFQKREPFRDYLNPNQF